MNTRAVTSIIALSVSALFLTGCNNTNDAPIDDPTANPSATALTDDNQGQMVTGDAPLEEEITEDEILGDDQGDDDHAEGNHDDHGDHDHEVKPGDGPVTPEPFVPQEGGPSASPIPAPKDAKTVVPTDDVQLERLD